MTLADTQSQLLNRDDEDDPEATCTVPYEYVPEEGLKRHRQGQGQPTLPSMPASTRRTETFLMATVQGKTNRIVLHVIDASQVALPS